MNFIYTASFIIGALVIFLVFTELFIPTIRYKYLYIVIIMILSIAVFTLMIYMFMQFFQ